MLYTLDDFNYMTSRKGKTMEIWLIDGETMETVRNFILGGSKSLQMVTAAMKLKDVTPWKENYDQLRQHIQKQRHYFANKDPSSQGYGFSCGHVWV